MRFGISVICFNALMLSCSPKDYSFVPAPSISSFNSWPNRIFQGQNTTLMPVFNDGAGFIDNGVGTVVSGTPYIVSPRSDTTYTMTVANAAGATLSAQVTVQVDTTPATISTFTALPTAVSYGQQTLLSWVVTGRPTSLLLDGVSALGESFRSVSPRRRQTYLLLAFNPLGGQARTLTVTARGLDVLAGAVGGPGSLDGMGSAARFKSPTKVALDTAGNLYVADTANYTVRKITPAGLVSTFAGLGGARGSVDGIGAAARFGLLSGVAVDRFGNVYVADDGNNTIRKITPFGAVRTLAGAAGMPGSADGPGSEARFNCPADVALDDSSNVYVADACNHTIRKINPAGIVQTIAGSPGIAGSADGIGSAARFNSPSALVVRGTGDVYVADTLNHTIRMVTPAREVFTIAGLPGVAGSADGSGAEARFHSPFGVALDSFGNVYAADGGNHTIRKLTPSGEVSTLAGSAPIPGSVDGTGRTARFSEPSGVAVDSSGNIYAADSGNHTIRKLTPTGNVGTLAGLPPRFGSADGRGGAARFYLPAGIAVDEAGQIYVADSLNETIRKVTAIGDVSTLAGSAMDRGTADGRGSEARFTSPQGIAADRFGNVYVADTGNHTIRKITPLGEVSTLAGSPGLSGYSDGSGSAARFTSLHGVATDRFGNVYVADTNNHTIRRVTPEGQVITLAGSPGRLGTADGPGAVARFHSPLALTVNGSGTIYVADSGNHTIRKVTPEGEVTTLAGSGGLPGHEDGPGSGARFNYPSGVAVDESANVYVADSGNHSIRKISSDAVVTTIAGNSGAIGAAPGELPASLYFPYGIALTPEGDLIVTSSNGVLQITAF